MKDTLTDEAKQPAGVDLAMLARHKADAEAAALRIAEYFVRCRPRFMNDLCEEDKIEFADFKTVSGYFGFSTDQYEG